ncbi:RNA polymerase sigma factor [Candidatus Kaiserbacteria bacterium]|nr:RNA polymerase sigma factor [Candidatus Kaiserbacteria bacterium]
MSRLLTHQFKQLYINEADSVFRFCYYRTSDREVAQDIAQDTFLRFWGALSRGGGRIRNERALLFAIARNNIIDWYRKKKAVSLDALIEESGAEGELFSDTSQKEKIEMDYEARSLIGKIRELDPLYQRIVYLRFVEDLRPREIATILGLSVNVVSVRLFRGLRQLRRLAGYEENAPGL